MEKILDQARVLVVTKNWNKQKRNNATIQSAPTVKNDLLSGFPGGSVKNPSVNAGEPRFAPGSRKIPHASQQLSL